MSKNPNLPHREDMAELTDIHSDFTDRTNDMAMVMQDQSYKVGRKRGLLEGRKHCAELLEALRELLHSSGVDARAAAQMKAHAVIAKAEQP